METVTRGRTNNVLAVLIVVAICLSVKVAAQTATPAPTTVVTAPLSELVIDQTVFAQATVVAANRAQMAAQVAAQIETVHVDVGDIVAPGDVLAELDTSDYELALEQARATLRSIEAQIAQATDRLSRARELSGSQYISADDLLSRETDVAVLQANRVVQQVAIRSAENTLRRTRIVAPYKAAVVARTAQRGSYVTVGSPLFELVELAAAEVEAQVAADLVAGLTTATQLFFTRGQQRWPLQLLRVTPVVDSTGGTQAVRLGFADTSAPVGSSGTMQWNAGESLLPADLILQRNGVLGVFVVENNRARF
ncbi:MAG: efflux RND transporter periplasmic adaptor subunit, partial [Gammaproteobacteria bacterium]|nr:efflux RND transporter periplasmic adaptor subunit [Gammaproteobacteria bacterium]